MVTIVSRNGVTLSANASANGFPLRPVLSPGAGDFARRDEGRARRQARRDKAARRSFEGAF